MEYIPRGLSLFCHQDLETVYCLTFFYMTKIDMHPICIHRAKYPIVVSGIIDTLQVIDLSIPCKYMHTHHEQCSISDVLSCINLLKVFILHLDNRYQISPTPVLTF